MEKLYYQNAYLKSFKSNVVKQTDDEAGNTYVVLEETAFYPTGGGQPHDLGTINNQEVVNVEEIEGEIRHYIKEPLRDVIGKVDGEIDWKRRFDHMQQHAGQHILSAAFESLFGYKTVSFHLGKEVLTIDLDIENLTEQEAEAGELLANRVILENRPIETKWVTEEGLSQYKLRKQLSVTDNIRLVIIPDFDYNGCGGTHPSDTAQVRAIKILDWEKQKKKVRVQFVCGERILEQLHQKHSVLLELTKLLNAPEREMAASALRLIETGKELERKLEATKGTLLNFEAKELLDANQGSDAPIIGMVYQDRTVQELQKLARSIVNANDNITFISVAENVNRIQIVGARGASVSLNMKTIIGNALPLINGKGGGNESFAQGGGEAILTGSKLLHHLVESARLFYIEK
ncbi:alanine--tRNA ligase-related protein [Neobacillus sp. FSL H8-0543]|uniref:alanyl-tRNA editing protein n=1 Tax=Neobacillus sp. FSL H8-0543 TaxID=2954672 RepID=UPI0031596039